MAAVKQADVVWEGDLAKGKGNVSGTSGKIRQLDVSWAARTGESDGRTSPEELLAAAHASCFAMALSAGLGRAGTPPRKLEVSARVTFDKVGEGWGVTKSVLQVRGDVPGADDAAFKKAADAAKDGCPISKALKGNVEMSVQASLARTS
jgi:osmotically inducible protein OsmC